MRDKEKQRMFDTGIIIGILIGYTLAIITILLTIELLEL
jgi:hypothetical protein